MKSTEIRGHVQSAQRQLRALGRPVPDIDGDALEERARVAEAELLKPATRGDVNRVLEALGAILLELRIANNLTTASLPRVVNEAVSEFRRAI